MRFRPINDKEELNPLGYRVWGYWLVESDWMYHRWFRSPNFQRQEPCLLKIPLLKIFDFLLVFFFFLLVDDRYSRGAFFLTIWRRRIEFFQGSFLLEVFFQDFRNLLLLELSDIADRTVLCHMAELSALEALDFGLLILVSF